MPEGERKIAIPGQRNFEQALAEACNLAAQGLLAADILEACRKAGAQYTESAGKKTITLRFLNELHLVTLPDVEVRRLAADDSVPARLKVLVLHYLITAKGSPLSARPITFKEMPEGVSYFPTFFKRTIKPVQDAFGKEPGRLVEAGLKLGGRKADFGDSAVTVDAFPRTPITFVIWKGDSELPASANVLYDSTITDYLPVEDIIVLSETVAWRLVREAPKN